MADMKKKSWMMNSLRAAAVFWAFVLIGSSISMASEEHHPPGAAEKSPVPKESSVSSQMPDHASGNGPGMMGMGPGMMGMGRGMMGMDPGMMGTDRGMMGQGMMQMMMSHMMGGPGGMGKMMGQMGAGMEGRPEGLRGMARMLEDLNLTPEQWGQVRVLAGERIQKMADLWAQRVKLQIELAGLRWDKEINPQQIKEVFVRKAEADADMFLTGLDYIRKLKSVLNPEQLQKMEARGL
jgi:hypothetical protein